ncbi:hypothetical protein QAD02_002613 [Eretmocerus hayati]|uniref:Uncharacterized protein n=1 Tax=Eretmocerus hayati TaxID=131215 RepID=A0ACC2NJP1_9HYME|nr:hypothetical protein QAD02_002613 [Eretmocerus hayati]
MSFQEQMVEPLENAVEYFCGHCYDLYLSEESLDKHMKIHNDKLMNYCKDCDKEFLSSLAKRTHDCPNRFSCQYCRKNMGIEHSRLVKEFQCHKCPQKFKFKTKLTHHLESAHAASEAHVCQDCSIYSKSQVCLRKHNILMHDKFHDKKPCLECHKLIPLRGMKKHVSEHNLHNEATKFKCQESLLCYSTEDDGTSACSTCSIKFVCHSDYKQHAAHHTEERLHLCEVCGLTFKTKSNLIQHIKNKHEAGKPFRCKYCTSTFMRANELVRHGQSHSKVKKYSYNLCHVKFRHYSSKVRHEKNLKCQANDENERSLSED